MSETTAVERFLAAGMGAAVAESTTLPVDIAKVRLQTQTPRADGTMLYRNMMQSMFVVGKNEGPTALWKGLSPALMRQVSYTGLSFVLYTPIRNFIAGENVEKQDIPFFKRVLSGGLAGGTAIVCMNPTDVIKTQMQTSTGKPKMVPIFNDILKNEGIKGFWRGVHPNIARCFVGNACEIGCYDQFKTWIVESGTVPDGPLTHLSASGGAGIVSAIFSTPVDVVKTRLMNQAGSGGEGGLTRYNGVVDCFVKIPKEEGFSAFYKGFTPLAVRKVTWTIFYFLAYEKALFMVSGKYS